MRTYDSTASERELDGDITGVREPSARKAGLWVCLSIQGREGVQTAKAYRLSNWLCSRSYNEDRIHPHATCRASVEHREFIGR